MQSPNSTAEFKSIMFHNFVSFTRRPFNMAKSSKRHDLTSFLGRAIGAATALAWMVWDLAAAATTQAQKSSNSNSKNNDEEKGDMLKGLAAGFGGFAGLMVLLCLLWCCCCTNDDSNSCKCCNKKKKKKNDKGAPHGCKLASDKAKVGPSPPHSAVGWSRTR